MKRFLVFPFFFTALPLICAYAGNPGGFYGAGGAPSCKGSNGANQKPAKLVPLEGVTSLGEAVKALNQKADIEYRNITGDMISPPRVVGEKGQACNELGAYIVIRFEGEGKVSFLIPDRFQRLSSTGGGRYSPSDLIGGLKSTDMLIGYHTGSHTDGNITIPSNTDMKGVVTGKFFSENVDSFFGGMVESSLSAEIVYDAKTGKNAGIDDKGFLFGFDEKTWDVVDYSPTQREYCNTIPGGQTKTRSQISEDFMASDEKINRFGACPAITIKDSEADKHYCLSFEFVREQKTMGNKIYKCTECGRETLVSAKRGETIEDVIAENKRDAEFNKSRIGMLQAAGIEDNAGNINSTAGGVDDEALLKVLTENGPASAGIILSTMQNQ